jgi:hypothetical protein
MMCGEIWLSASFSVARAHAPIFSDISTWRTDMSEIDYEATARAAGWDLGREAPHGNVLVHKELDRIWPEGDWKGALEDMGFDAADPEWADDIVYVAEIKPGF